MTTKQLRGRIATACLAAMLPPVGAVADPVRIDPVFDFCRTPRSRVVDAPAAVAADLWAPAVPLIRIDDTPPWFRKTFYLFGADGTCPVKPAVVAPVAGSPASASLEVSEIRPPGTVKNLRRTDRR